MFFIFGSPRSGTTLLAQCLNAHTGIVVPDETDFIIPLAFIFDRLPDPAIRRSVLKQTIVGSARFSASIGEYLAPAQVEAIIDTHAERADLLLDAIYAAVAERAGASRAGDKSPNDLLFLRMLIKVRGISPDARIIHIVRDVRDVVSSIVNAKWVADIEHWFPRLWSTSNLYLWDLYRASDQYRLVRYEEFVRAPERFLRLLCAHLGVEYEPTMIDSDRRHPRYRSQPTHGRLYEQISDAYIGAYRSSLRAEIVARCEVQAAEAMRVFGY
jgi:hypothetical protein